MTLPEPAGPGTESPVASPGGDKCKTVAGVRGDLCSAFGPRQKMPYYTDAVGEDAPNGAAVTRI